MFFELRVVRNEFPRIAVELPILAERVASHAADEIARGAAARSRVDTGAMQAGWDVQGLRISDPVYYTRFHEYGTVKMTAQPMLGPAMEAEADPFFAELAAALWR